MCSVISLNPTGMLATARNMDFNIGMVGNASAFVPANTELKFLDLVTVKAGPNAVKTICNYMPGFKGPKSFAIWQESINDKGLSFSLLFNVDNSAASGAPQDGDASMIAWPAEMMVNMTTVDQVRNAMKSVKRFHLPNIPLVTGEIKKMATCHFYFADASGDAIVIEMHEGIPTVYDCPIGVMTNGPEYSWHMTNLRNYFNVSNNGVDAAPKNWPNSKDRPYNYKKIGHGDGFLGVPGGNGSPDRFIRIALNKLWATEITKDNAPAKAAALVGLGYTAMGTQNSENGGDKDQTIWTSLKVFNASEADVDKRITLMVKTDKQFNFEPVALSTKSDGDDF